MKAVPRRVGLVRRLLWMLWLLWWPVGTAAMAQDLVDGSDDAKFRHLSVLAEALGLAQRAYVEPLQVEAQVAAALEGMLDALDPFAVYVSEERWPAYREARRIGSRRSGLLVLKERGVAYAMAVEPDSPAAEAGLERGDVISTVAGESTRDMPLDRIQTLLAGPVGARVEVEWIRRGDRERASLVLREIVPPKAARETHRGVTLVRLGSFADTTVAEAERLLTDFELAGEERLILDLRGHHGGDPEVAYSVAGLFVSGDLGHLVSRGRVLDTFTRSSEPIWRGRLAVLTDRGTQGAAEVLAAVLQQAAEAIVVGMYSFGHCGRETVLPLRSDGRLVLADAYYTGPDQEPLDRALEPQVVVRRPPGERIAEGDAVLERAIAALSGEEVSG